MELASDDIALPNYRAERFRPIPCSRKDATRVVWYCDVRMDEVCEVTGAHACQQRLVLPSYGPRASLAADRLERTNLVPPDVGDLHASIETGDLPEADHAS